MLRYRNVRTGRVIERPQPDEWLEASSGWERVEPDPAPSGDNEQDDEGSKD